MFSRCLLLACCLVCAPWAAWAANPDGLGGLLVKQLNEEHAWLREAMHDIAGGPNGDAGSLEATRKWVAKDKHGCKELVCNNRENVAVLFSRLDSALLQAEVDGKVLARTYEELSDKQMGQLRHVLADMERSQSAIFWRGMFSGLADFAAQMAYSIATGDAKSMEAQLGTLAAAASEYAVNQQFNGVRATVGKKGDEIAAMLDFKRLKPDAMSRLTNDWSWIGLFEYKGGRILFKPKVSVLDDPLTTGGSVLVSKIVDGAIKTGAWMFDGVGFKDNYEKKQRMYAKGLRDVLMQRVAAAMAEAEVKYIHEQRMRLWKIFDDEVRAMASCKRDEKRKSCEAAYRQALEQAARDRDKARLALREREDKLTAALERAKAEKIEAARHYARTKDEYFRLRRLWQDARKWQQDDQFRSDIEGASCATCKLAKEARRELKYYRSLPPASELEKQVKAMWARLEALNAQQRDLWMKVENADAMLRNARWAAVEERGKIERTYETVRKKAEKRLGQCTDVKLPEMKLAHGAHARIQRGNILGWKDIMVPVHAAMDPVTALFSKPVADWRYSQRKECRDWALGFDFMAMKGVGGCWRTPNHLPGFTFLPAFTAPGTHGAPASDQPKDVVLSLRDDGRKGELILNGEAFPIEGGKGKDGRLHLVHRLTWKSLKFLRSLFPSMAETWPFYLEWTFDLKPASQATGFHRLLIPARGRFDSRFPMLPLTPAGLQSENAPVTKVSFTDASGKPVREVTEGDRLFIRAEGKTLCPHAVSTLAVNVQVPGGKPEPIVLRETAPGSGVLTGPKGGIIARLPAGNDEARLVVTDEGAMMREVYGKQMLDAMRRGSPAMTSFGGAVRRMAGALSAEVLVRRGSGGQEAQGAVAAGSLYYRGPAFEASVHIRMDVPEYSQPIEQHGKLFMRPGALRMELSTPGQPSSVSIYREDKRLQWTIYPHSRTYMEQTLPAPALSFEQKERSNGRELSRYRYVQGKFTGNEWRDERGIPLRRVLDIPCGKSRCKMEMEVSDVRLRGKLDDSLFELPAGHAPMASPVGMFR